jgi:hypothetical protein
MITATSPTPSPAPNHHQHRQQQQQQQQWTSSKDDCERCIDEERRLERRLVPCLPCVTCCWCLRPTIKRNNHNLDNRNRTSVDRNRSPTDDNDGDHDRPCCETGGCCGPCCATERGRLSCAQSGWGYGTAQVIVMILLFAILYGVLAIDASDAGTVSCHTTEVSVVAQRCTRGSPIASVQRDCLQSYRRLQWTLPPLHVNDSVRIFWHSVAESNCDWTGQETPSCGFNSSILLARARSYLGLNLTCWIYYNSGQYYDPPLAGGRNPEQAKLVYRNVTVAWIPLMLLLGFMYGLTRWLHHSYLTHVVNTRQQRHEWHSSPFVAFLLALASSKNNTIPPSPASPVSVPLEPSSSPIATPSVTMTVPTVASTSTPSSSSSTSCPVTTGSALRVFVNDPLYDRHIIGLIGEFAYYDIAARVSQLHQNHQDQLSIATDGVPSSVASNDTNNDQRAPDPQYARNDQKNVNQSNSVDNTVELVHISYLFDHIRDEMLMID